ncbi:MAG: hypothetical protein U5L45_05525 [Saprospiraceae bacterium]|nr:hypothetical protein [Saprospiraceae bacterium]
MVHFSGFARKMNHLSSFCASEASAKMPFNAYFEFMYGFKNLSISKPKFCDFVAEILLPRRYKGLNLPKIKP